MRLASRFFNFVNWSIWSRFVLALLVVVMVPTVIAFVLIEREVRSVDRLNLEAYLSERGLQQRDDLADNFNRVRQEMKAFVENDTQRGFLLRRLTFNSDVSEVVTTLRTYMNERMVNSGVFSSVRLIDGDGVVQLVSDVIVLGEIVSPAIIGDDERDTAAYRAYTSALDVGENQRWAPSFDVNSNFQIEIVQVVRNADGPVGYIVGTVNVTAMVIDVLETDSTFLDTTSFLVASGGGVLSSTVSGQSLDVTERSLPFSEGLAQRTGLTPYDMDGQAFIAYHSPILDTPFAVIIETPLQINFIETLDTIYDQGFIIVAALVIFAFLVAASLVLSIVPALQSLEANMEAINDGDFQQRVTTTERNDEIGTLSKRFIAMREQIRSLIEDQESRLEETVRDLQATQEVSRFAATQRDLQPLMDDVVALIVNVFPNIYHAQIFLIDVDREFAVLRASTGEAGRQLLSRGHRLGVGSVSVIGQVTEEGRVVVARDTGESEVHQRNEFLLDTRAELAIPLRFGEQIIGALDVQSKLSDSFTTDQITLLQTMSDQIAIAIENTRLYQESIRRLEELESANKEATRRAWREYLNYQRQRVLTSKAGTYTAADHVTLRQKAIETQEPAIGATTERNTRPFAVPIKLRGQIIGAVDWEVPESEFNNEKVQLAVELVSRLAITLDNARLFQSSQRAIDRERLVNEITSKLTGYTDIEEILRTAVREVGQALRAPQVEISLNIARDDDQSNENKNGVE